MSFISSASGDSQWRGYEYWKEKKVLFYECFSDHEAEGVVKGSKEYHVKIDTEHPRKSACDCPFAHGRRVICKHMVALYFTLYPHEAEEYHREIEAAQEAWENEQEEIEQKLIDYIRKMGKEKLRDTLLELLFDGPDWQYERFIREHLE